MANPFDREQETEEGADFKLSPSPFSVGQTAQSTPATVSREDIKFTPVELARTQLEKSSLAQEEFRGRAAEIGLDPRIADAAAGGLASPQRVVGAAQPTLTAAQKLVSAIRSAGKPRQALEEAFTAERSVRAARGSKALEGGGEAGARAALGQLRGELAPKPKFEPIRDFLSQADVDELFTQVSQAKNLDFFEKVTANNGLWKLFNGEVPPKSQLALMEDVFGSDLVKAVRDKRSGWEKLGSTAVDVLNIPRSLITSVDMSAPLRQGILFTVTKPRQSIPAFGEMFQDFFSEKKFNQWLLDIPNNPRYQQMKGSGLYIANPNKLAGGLASREEAFMSNLAEKVPLWGSLVKASSRAYVGYLNKLRVDVFTQLASKFEKDGVASPENLKALANFVNKGTGRGNLGSFEKVAAELNTTFFSPRLIASRVQLLNPVWYARQPAPVMKEAVKSFAEFVGVGSTILAIAAANGADVETDPRSSDFGKIKVGDTRWDIWGGFQQWVRVFSQLASGERKTARGEIMKLSKDEFPFTTRFDTALQFGRGKLAPVPSLITELLDGNKKIFGEDITLTGEIAENTIPLYLQDMKEAIDEFGPDALITVGVPAFFGVGTQTYKPSGSNPF